MKKLSLATAVLASVFTMGANAYQYEGNASYEKSDYDIGGKVDAIAVGGKYYLNAVQAKGAPLAEAAFASNASNVAVGYATADDLDLDAYGVSGEFFIPNTQFYVSGTLNQIKDAGDKNTGYAVEAGYLPINGLLVAVGVAKENVDPAAIAKNGLTTTIVSAFATGEDTAATVRAKYLTQIGGFYTNFEGSIVAGDETAYKLGADLYLDPTLSVGASFADSTIDGADTVFGIRAQKFFTQQIAAGVNYTTTDGVDSFGINGTFRF